MHRESALPVGVQQQVGALGGASIVVGIPSYNSAQTIGHVAAVAAAGARRRFPESRVVLVNADGGSSDRTQEVVRDLELPPAVERIVFSYRGIPGKGSALRAIFEVAAAIGADACVVVDSDLRSVTPEWIGKLGEPILEGYDFVAPYYIRHKHDATITNSICYPLTRALYGLRVRQPIGGDFGVSGRLVRLYLEKDVWLTDVARFGVDVFMTTTAIVESGKVVQAALGAKVHDTKDPGADLGPMFKQVVSTLFEMMSRYELAWKGTRGSRAVEIRGAHSMRPTEPDPVRIDLERLVRTFRAGAREHGATWQAVLGRTVAESVEKLAAAKEPDLSAHLWVSVVYAFAAAYCHGVAARKTLLEALIPLYNARVAAFAREARDMTSREAEALIEGQCVLFEQAKPELARLWESRRRPAEGPEGGGSGTVTR